MRPRLSRSMTSAQAHEPADEVDDDEDGGYGGDGFEDYSDEFDDDDDSDQQRAAALTLSSPAGIRPVSREGRSTASASDGRGTPSARPASPLVSPSVKKRPAETLAVPDEVCVSARQLELQEN